MRCFDLPPDALEAAEQPLPDRPGTAAATALPADSYSPAMQLQEGETVYDYAWYPGMSAADPASCCFATTSRVSDRRSSAWRCRASKTQA